MDEMTSELRQGLQELLDAYSQAYVVPPSHPRLKEAMDQGWQLVKRIPGKGRLLKLAAYKAEQERCNTSCALWFSTSLALAGAALGMQSLVLTDPAKYPASLTLAFLNLTLASAAFVLYFLGKIGYVQLRIGQLHYGRYKDSRWRQLKWMSNALGFKVIRRMR